MRILSLFLVILFFSCSSAKNEKSQAVSTKETSKVDSKAIKHFSIQNLGESYLIEIASPFVGANFSERYVLYPREGEKPQLDSVTHYIPYPIESIAITSTTHVGFLSVIDGLDYIKAVSYTHLTLPTKIIL